MTDYLSLPTMPLPLPEGSKKGFGCGVKTTWRPASGALTTPGPCGWRGIRAGTVWIWGNYAQPVEGIWGGYKQSGMGRELGYHGLEDFLEVKQIFTDGKGLTSKPPYGQVIKE